jgi:hypothetical protein
MRRRLQLLLAAGAAAVAGALLAALYLGVRRPPLSPLDAALLAEAREEALLAGTWTDKPRLREAPGVYDDRVRPADKYAAAFRADGSVLTATRAFQACAGPPDLLRQTVEAPFDLACGTVLLRGVIVRVPRAKDLFLLLALPRE